MRAPPDDPATRDAHGPHGLHRTAATSPRETPVPAPRRRWRRRRSAAARRARRVPGPRRGFTLVEQLVAVTVLGVGLLSLAGGGVALQRRARHALVHGDAASRAAARLERLAATPCAGLADGAGAGERWMVEGDGPARTVRYEVGHAVDGATGVRRFTGAVRCAP